MRATPRRDYEGYLRTLGLDARGLTLDASGTLAASPKRPHADRPPVSHRGAQAFELGRVLGRGGVGVVRAAVQGALGREVAVKQLRRGPHEDDPHGTLLAEAVVTGHLEHPNVVPIHSLTKGADGRPALVMKLIRGSLWSDYLAAPNKLSEEHPSVRDPLEFHIDVLMTVCNAIEFAHARGVVHRDIKPTNVMIGSFGEVYLLDWGLAVGLREDGPAELPLAKDVDEPAGSPGYMAPEMAAAEGSLIDERTDVYLLGAVLHEVLTSSPPHQGSTLLETLQSAFRAAPPQLGDDVPLELADICRRALAFDPAHRFEGAGAFRDALAGFLRHRAARALSQEADRKAVARERALDEHDLEAAQRLGTEARFAYQLALREWPENDAARERLRALISRLAAHEIARGNADAARALLGELDEVSGELAEELSALEDREERNRQRVHALERMREDTDLGRQEKSRTQQLTFIGGVIFAVVSLISLLRQTGLLRVSTPLVFVVVAMLTAVSYFTSRRRVTNTANLRTRRGFFYAMLIGTAYMGVATIAGQDITLALAVLMFLFAGCTAVGTALLHASTMVSALIFFTMGSVLLIVPSSRPIVMPLGILLVFVALVYSSRRAAHAEAKASGSDGPAQGS